MTLAHLESERLGMATVFVQTTGAVVSVNVAVPRAPRTACEIARVNAQAVAQFCETHRREDDLQTITALYGSFSPTEF